MKTIKVSNLFCTSFSNYMKQSETEQNERMKNLTIKKNHRENSVYPSSRNPPFMGCKYYIHEENKKKILNKKRGKKSKGMVDQCESSRNQQENKFSLKKNLKYFIIENTEKIKHNIFNWIETGLRKSKRKILKKNFHNTRINVTNKKKMKVKFIWKWKKEIEALTKNKKGKKHWKTRKKKRKQKMRTLNDFYSGHQNESENQMQKLIKSRNINLSEISKEPRKYNHMCNIRITRNNYDYNNNNNNNNNNGSGKTTTVASSSLVTWNSTIHNDTALFENNSGLYDADNYSLEVHLFKIPTHQYSRFEFIDVVKYFSFSFGCMLFYYTLKYILRKGINYFYKEECTEENNSIDEEYSEIQDNLTMYDSTSVTSSIEEYTDPEEGTSKQLLNRNTGTKANTRNTNVENNNMSSCKTVKHIRLCIEKKKSFGELNNTKEEKTCVPIEDIQMNEIKGKRKCKTKHLENTE